jgi:hypothetical protein
VLVPHPREPWPGGHALGALCSRRPAPRHARHPDAELAAGLVATICPRPAELPAGGPAAPTTTDRPTPGISRGTCHRRSPRLLGSLANSTAFSRVIQDPTRREGPRTASSQVHLARSLPPPMRSTVAVTPGPPRAELAPVEAARTAWPLESTTTGFGPLRRDDRRCHRRGQQIAGSSSRAAAQDGFARSRLQSFQKFLNRSGAISV